MFNLSHILFIIISAVLLATTLLLCKIYIKNQDKKDLVLKIAAILTLVLHYSPLYVNFFTTGTATITDTMILPMYPCNFAMWLLVICAFMKNKQSKTYNVIATMTFYLGLIGGVFGILFNEIFIDNPTLADWGVLHGLLSHVTLLLGCVYLYVGEYMKIRVSNLFSIFICEVLLILDGYLIIGLFKLCNLPLINCMFLLNPPLPSVPWLNTYVLCIAVLIILFGFTALYEFITLKKEDRWYNKIKSRKDNEKSKTRAETVKNESISNDESM